MVLTSSNACSWLALTDAGACTCAGLAAEQVSHVNYPIVRALQHA